MCLVLEATAHARKRGTEIEELSDLGEWACGVKGRIASNCSVVVTQLGFCTNYCIFIAENLQAVVFEANGGEVGGSTVTEDTLRCDLPGVWDQEGLVYFIILAVVPTIIPTTFVRQLKYFGWPARL